MIKMDIFCRYLQNLYKIDLLCFLKLYKEEIIKDLGQAILKVCFRLLKYNKEKEAIYDEIIYIT